jgi:hypothetical protein
MMRIAAIFLVPGHFLAPTVLISPDLGSDLVGEVNLCFLNFCGFLVRGQGLSPHGDNTHKSSMHSQDLFLSYLSYGW